MRKPTHPWEGLSYDHPWLRPPRANDGGGGAGGQLLLLTHRFSRDTGCLPPTALPSASGTLWRGRCCRWPSKWKTGLRSHCTAVWAVIPVLTSPWREGLTFEDYELTFPEACTPRQVVFSPALQVAPERPAYPLEEGRKLPLRHELFDLDAVVLAGAPRQQSPCPLPRAAMGSLWPILRCPMWASGTSPRLTRPMCALSPGPFSPGRDNLVEELSQMPDMTTVAPGQTFENRWSITIW